MITVAQATEKIINRSRYLSEALSKGLINTSSLARYIQPELEQMLKKKISEAAILMAITRLTKDVKPHYISHAILTESPEMILRSQLHLAVYPQTQKVLTALLEVGENQSFFLLSKAKNIGVLYPKSLEEKIANLSKKTPLHLYRNVSALTITLPTHVLTTPGMYYFFLKSLAWEGINILELFSLEESFTMVFEEKDANTAYGIVQSLI